MTLINPTGRAFHFARVSVDVRDTGSDGCSPEWFRTGAVSIPEGGVAVPANSSINLSAQGIPGPTIQMRESGTDQNACRAPHSPSGTWPHPARGLPARRRRLMGGAAEVTWRSRDLLSRCWRQLAVRSPWLA